MAWIVSTFGTETFRRGVFCNSCKSLLSKKRSTFFILKLNRCTMNLTDASLSNMTERAKKGLIQHKKEAFWFYRFLSIVYDTIVNPFHWTVEMRDTSLKQAELVSRDLKVLDAGGGTGFTTEGIVQYVDAHNITLLDQSPHQMAKAKKKPKLSSVNFVEGDAENLPFPSNSFDRYISAGSIEYWPEPQRGISEAYRVLRCGGVATVIGPVRATHWFSRFWCDLWMLFPTEEEYRYWFQKAGFEDIRVSYIGPAAYKGIREHGLIMGLTISGKKPVNGPSEPVCRLGPMQESLSSPYTWQQKLLFPFRWLLGCIAGFYYFLLPFFIMFYAAVFMRDRPTKDSQTRV